VGIVPVLLDSTTVDQRVSTVRPAGTVRRLAVWVSTLVPLVRSASTNPQQGKPAASTVLRVATAPPEDSPPPRAPTFAPQATTVPLALRPLASTRVLLASMVARPA
jgi:hypothetical protein